MRTRRNSQKRGREIAEKRDNRSKHNLIFKIMANDNKAYNGWKQSTADPDKLIRGNHWVKRDGDSLIIKTSIHNRYPGGLSGKALEDRLNK